MEKDEIFVNGIRKYICMGYDAVTEKAIYEINPEYDKLFSPYLIDKKFSKVKTKECTIWDDLKSCYVESDEDFKKRLIEYSEQ